MKIKIKETENQLQCELFNLFKQAGWNVYVEVSKIFRNCRFDIVLCDKDNNIKHIIELKRRRVKLADTIYQVSYSNADKYKQTLKYYNVINEAKEDIKLWFCRLSLNNLKNPRVLQWIKTLK